jgi:hypothetical protein
MSIIVKPENIFLLWLLFTIIACKSPVNVADSFETPTLSTIRATGRMTCSTLQMQSKIVRKGNSAAMITLHSGDVFEAGTGTSANSERDELREADKLMSVEGKVYEYTFSLFSPDSFPIVPTRLVMAQWKQKCPGDSSCSDDIVKQDPCNRKRQNGL